MANPARNILNAEYELGIERMKFVDYFLVV